MRKLDACIIGGGIGGLATAFELKRNGYSVLILETSDRLGGALRSEMTNGFLLEHGPNTVLPRPEILELAASLGLREKILFSSKKLPRFIQLKGKLHKAPLGALSLKGLFRMLSEPFVKTASTDADESIWEFSSRRWGQEVADNLIAPFVSGIWAGDSKNLSMVATFPQIAEWEKKYKSVFWGFLKKPGAEKRKTPGGLISFKGGLETLTKALSIQLAEDIFLNSKISSVQCRSLNGEKAFVVSTPHGTHEANTLVLTQPAWSAGSLIENFSKEGAQALRAIPYSPLKVIHLGYEKSAVKHPLKGFGYLVPPSEKSAILGCLWSSILFPERAPENSVLLTVFMGGSNNPEILSQTDSDIYSLATQALRPILNIQGEPQFKSLTTYEKAIPQYTIGHQQRLKAIRKMESDWPGLFFSGNYLDGISVSDVIRNAGKTALQVQKSVRA